MSIALRVVATMALAAFASRVHAADGCAPYKEIATHLLEAYHEAPVSEALIGTDSSGVVVFFASPRGETWTLVVADARGERGCVVMAGTQWTVSQRARPHIPGQPL